MSWNYGKALGEEARYRKRYSVRSGVNIYRTPLNGRNFEYMGEDPYLTSKMVVPYIKGVQSNGVATSVKHFALNNGRNSAIPAMLLWTIVLYTKYIYHHLKRQCRKEILDNYGSL